MLGSMAPVIGAGISAGAGLLGGAMADDATAAANAQANRIRKQQLKYQRKIDRKNIELQKDFAQQGIRWKVADAEAAGISPLYALGAQTMSFNPISVGGGGGFSPAPEHGMANALASAGQDVSRAIGATRTQQERELAYVNSARALHLTNMGLENEMLATQIAKQRGGQVGPPLPGLDGPIPEKPASARARLKFGGDWWETNPWFSSAQDLEDRYGEEGPVARYAVPAITLGGDAIHNSGRLLRWLLRQGFYGNLQLD